MKAKHIIIHSNHKYVEVVIMRADAEMNRKIFSSMDQALAYIQHSKFDELPVFVDGNPT